MIKSFHISNRSEGKADCGAMPSVCHPAALPVCALLPPLHFLFCHVCAFAVDAGAFVRNYGLVVAIALDYGISSLLYQLFASFSANHTQNHPLLFGKAPTLRP